MNICFYTFQSPVTIHIANRLVDSGKIGAIILQRPMSARDKLAFLAHRVRRYGLLKVVDELLFWLYYRLFLKRGDERLRASHFPKALWRHEIKKTGASVPVYEVDSINSASGKELLDRLKPDLVIMESREMIRPDILAIPRLGFVGCHPGIIPDYRGVYASFWAMARGELDKVGLSVYLADAGVDTGGIISQRRSRPKFPLRHFKVEAERLMVEGVDDLLGVIEMAGCGGALTISEQPGSASRLFSHIGLSDYLRAAAKDSAG